MPEPSIHAGDHVGEYLLLERLSLDPLSVAWKARSAKGSRLVTVRMPCDQRVAERFHKLGGELRSPKSRHLLRTLRRMEADGRCVVIQEFAEGTLLHDLISRQGQLPPGRAKHLFIQILRGLAELHRDGLAHGNLRPDRVVVTRWDAVKLGDVGTGRICSQLATERLRDAGRNGHRSNGLLAFVAYQSPEQRRGEQVGPAADVYAAGLLLYEMLTGRPYGGELTAAELAEMPDWAAELLPACLDIAEFRYATALEALEALGALPRWATRQSRPAEQPQPVPADVHPLKRRGKLKSTQRRSVRKMVAWITIMAAVLIPGAFFVLWLSLWRSPEQVAPLHAEEGPAGGQSPSRWHEVKRDCMWRWEDSLRDATGRDMLPAAEHRFLLVRLRAPAAAGGEGLSLRSDGSQASITDGEGTRYACRGHVAADGYRPVDSGRSPVVAPGADGWMVLVFELPGQARRLRLRVRGFGGVWDTPLDTPM